MKKQDITYQDKLNELRLDVSHPNSKGLVFILVEGNTDIRLFRKLFNLDNSKVEIIPGGNTKVEECVTELLRRNLLIIGLRDADFLHLTSTPYTKQNMFLTDFHDIEMMMIAENETFSAIIHEYTDINLINHYSIRDNILKAIEEISLLKWLNSIENLDIKFEGTGFQDLISFDKLNVDFQKYISRLSSKPSNCTLLDIETIISKIDNLRDKNPHSLQLCNGHDFINAFSKFLKEQGETKGNISESLIASIFRINFSNDFFSKTLLHKKTKIWAEANNCSIHN